MKLFDNLAFPSYFCGEFCAFLCAVCLFFFNRNLSNFIFLTKGIEPLLWFLSADRIVKLSQHDISICGMNITGVAGVCLIDNSKL